MIEIKNISFSYRDKEIFKDFSLTINDSDKICIFGESGQGKTTLLRLIAGLEKPQDGIIKKPDNLKISVVFQENLLLPFKSVIENITIMGAQNNDALYHLNALGILETANKRPDTLSGGMQRRVSIARALANDFDILILDEPFTGLDIENVKISAEHILNTAKNRPVIIVTHSLEEAELLGAKIIKI